MSAAIRALPVRAPATRPTLRAWAPHLPSLLLSLVPAVVAPLGLVALTHDPRFAHLATIVSWPPELGIVALAGSLATLAGVLDWLHHRELGVIVGRPERRAELLALGLGGVPLFGLMCAATLSSQPLVWLLPVLLALVVTTTMVVYDEVAFHRRRCAPVEHLLHRTITIGHLTAFLAWASWVFVRGVEVAS
jgi:hypothetical protein